MNTTTLRGIFPEPKPVHRRNFIKENIKQVKQMQGLLQESGLINPRVRSDKYRNTPPKAASNVGAPTKKSRHQLIRSLSQNSKLQGAQDSGVQHPAPKLHLKPRAKHSMSEDAPVEQRFTNRAMQTERIDDLTELYETGVIKYPSPSVLGKRSPKFNKKSLDSGDRKSNDLADAMENLELNDKDYVRENIKNIKQKMGKSANISNILGNSKDPTMPPPTYQKGVLPRYLQDRKEELRDKDSSFEPECPPGHVLLPDEERKETLRVLRQSYADRIQELNSMPVRSDTLKMRKRKNDIEEELKKIDEGIKVFQRPKVFVKINV